MSKRLSYVLFAVLVALLAVGMGLMLHCCREARGEMTCNALDVEITDDFEFVSAAQVAAYIEADYGKCVGRHIDSIALGRIETLLEKRSVILDSEAWTTDDGVLHVSVRQRKPKVCCKGKDKGWYIDKEGFAFPMSSGYEAEVLTIEGNIPDLGRPGREQWIAGVLELERFISGSRTWRGRIATLRVDDKGDIRLTTTDGDEQFILGYPDNIPEKFARMEKYYSHILPSLEDGKRYKSVNLKFNKQLICRKDI